MISQAEKNPIKILHVFGRMDRGGAEIRTLEILRKIDRERFLTHFASLSGLPGQLDGDIRDLGSEVHLCKLGWGFPRRFTALLQKEQIDVVHSHVHFSSGYILRLAEKAGVRGRIAHFRSTQDGRTSSVRRNLQRRVSRWLVQRHATQIIAVGYGAMVTLFGEDWRKDSRRVVIADGVDLSPFSATPDREGVRREFGLSGDCPLIIHVGNFHKPKNHSFLISVFEAIKKQFPHVALLLVGGGNEKQESLLRDRVEDLHLGDSVFFAGCRKDVPRLLLAADMMIFPSLWEGLPGAVLEAAAAGIPVLGSEIPGIVELVPSLPQIRCMGLECGVEAWAKTACDSLPPGYDINVQNELKARFAAGSYTVDQCVSKTCAVWEEAARG